MSKDLQSKLQKTIGSFLTTKAAGVPPEVAMQEGDRIINLLESTSLTRDQLERLFTSVIERLGLTGKVYRMA